VGTDCLWWGSPQWVIDLMKRFQITDPNLCKKFGYEKLTKEDKARSSPPMRRKLYGIDVKAKRNALPRDTLNKLKMAYLDNGACATTRPRLGAPTWVRRGF